MFNILSKIGISWTIYCRLCQLVIRYDVEKYYKTLWKIKIKQFINEWRKGSDSLTTLYKKVRLLTVEYDKPIENVRAPYITTLLLERNDYLSIEIEMEKLERLFVKTEDYIKKNREHCFYPELSQFLMDIKTSIHQIKHVLSSGYCFASFILLRKLIESFGGLIFVHSIPNHFSEIEDESFAMEMNEKKWIELIEKWMTSFRSGNEWFPVSLSGGDINLCSVPENKGNEVKIRNIETFKKTISNKGKGYYSPKNLINAGGTFLTEQLDVIRTYGEDAYTYAQSDEDISKGEKEIYEMYSKLSGIVHEPIFIDYPPFASFIEYLAFLHYLRKTIYLLNEVFYKYTNLRK